jgi:hypothetical protein
MERAGAGADDHEDAGEPTRAATQRRHPTVSPRSGIDRAAMKTGDTKVIAEASAMARCGREGREQEHGAHEAEAAQELQAGMGRAHPRGPLRDRGRGHDEAEPEIAQPRDHDDRDGCGEILRGDVRAGEEERGGQDQGHAAQRIVTSGRHGRSIRCCGPWRTSLVLCRPARCGPA